jgi:histidinol-phosphatase
VDVAGKGRSRLERELRFALELADLADEISLAHFRTAGLVVEQKPDLSPVTVADRAVEQALRGRIAAERPGHTVLGEEYGGADAAGPRWIVDPIDGTRKYVRGIPNFATLIALEENGELLLGVASAPAMRRRWCAARGLGAFADGRPIRVSNIARVEDSHILHGSLDGWVRAGRVDALASLAARCWHTNGYADFWIHLLVAEGAAEAAVEPEAAVWDLAALKVIVEEAGGRFTDMGGVDTVAGGTGLSTNGLIHDDVLAALQHRLDTAAP